MIDTVQEEYNYLANIYDQRWSFYIAKTVAKLMDQIQGLQVDYRHDQSAKILDLGCGTGALTLQLLNYFPTAQIFGIDLSSAMLDVALQKLITHQQRLNLSLKDATDLDFSTASFDLVVSSSVFHYFTEPNRTLSNIYRILKPGGYLIINDWCGDYLTCSLLDRYLHLTKRPHFHTYTKKELRALLTKQQFTVTDLTTYQINWFWGMMIATSVKPSPPLLG
ncbi:MAG: class I SAM-dependent methyltransferase [Pseudanabaena sp. ELA607]